MDIEPGAEWSVGQHVRRFELGDSFVFNEHSTLCPVSHQPSYIIIIIPQKLINS